MKANELFKITGWYQLINNKSCIEYHNKYDNYICIYKTDLSVSFDENLTITYSILKLVMKQLEEIIKDD